MDYITVKQASEKWGINPRQVQWLCNNGKVEGSIRFNRSWAIPEDTPKPKDGRKQKETDYIAEQMSVSSTEPLNTETFNQIFDLFPYSINVTNRDGYMIYANETFFEGTLDKARETALGNYNILNEELQEKWGLKEHIAKAFKGQRVYTPNLKFPNKDLIGDKYGKDSAFISIYNDVTSFPIFDSDHQLKYVVSVFVPVRRFTGRQEVVNVKEYLETNWMKPFDSNCVAKSANMSLSRFLWLFRTETGFSPHDYYMEIKMNHIKEHLLDSSLSVSQAFNACGTEYNSHYAKLFKKHTGFTPTDFRKIHK